MKIQAVRGMQDILPDLKEIYRYVEDTVRSVLDSYGYREIGLPVLESTHLFQRLVGETTDIVEKEMYTFVDRNGDSLTLRPEGTAGCVRAAQENGLIFNQVQKLWYSGSMFRHERPQKGRYRQFESIGAECFGLPGPDIDCELILMTRAIWKKLGIDRSVSLEINSLGDSSAREQYRKALVEYFSEFKDKLDEDSLRRLGTNPLRILDSKEAGTRKLVEDAPVLTDYLDDASRQHFEELCEMLSRAGVDYHVNKGIVRGLDYYNRTVFEWITTDLGSQGTICGGGRYDGLVEMIGGRSTPGVGFGIGIDRVALLVREKSPLKGQKGVDIYIASVGSEARREALLLAEELRDSEPCPIIIVHCGDGKLKNQMKKADQSGAGLVLILGEDELRENKVSIKNLRDESEQLSIDRNRINDYLRKQEKRTEI